MPTQTTNTLRPMLSSLESAIEFDEYRGSADAKNEGRPIQGVPTARRLLHRENSYFAVMKSSLSPVTHRRTSFACAAAVTLAGLVAIAPSAGAQPRVVDLRQVNPQTE